MIVNIPVPVPSLCPMARAPFSLSDDQARQLAICVATLQATYPYDGRNHRPFVRGFMRAVQEVTAHLYSPAIYQRLLSAFASERRPSTATLAAEKQVLANKEVIQTVIGAEDTADGLPRSVLGPSQLHAIVSDAVDVNQLTDLIPQACSHLCRRRTTALARWLMTGRRRKCDCARSPVAEGATRPKR